jgi:DNA polymerase-3 subunit delta
MPAKLSTIFKKKVITVPFANPHNKNEIKEFIKLGLQKSGKRINPDALNYFAENTEGDALTINSEVEKTVLFCREKNIINVEDIEEILSRGHKFTIFNLVDEIGRGNIENALIFLSNLLEKGEHPLYILKMISRQFRLICRAREGIRRGDSASIIGQLLNLRYDGIIKSIITQAKGWTDEGLGKAFEEIFQSDFMIKSSRIKGKVILENLVFRLINFRNQLSA